MSTAPVPKMPPGLVELMEDLAKDVLRCNPPDVYSFCASHMKKLIEIRDGPTPNRAMTLEQKIAMAIKKTRQRAARRCEDYDKKMQTGNQLDSQNNEYYENNGITENESDAKQYIKDKIVKIPEEDLTGDKEHEIIANLKEKALVSESVKHTEKDTETTLAEVNSVYPDSPATLQESNITNGVKCSVINVIENIDYKKAADEVSENLTSEKKAIEITQIDSQAGDTNDTVLFNEEICLESVETVNDNESQSTTVELLKNKDYVECETSPKNYNNLENFNNKANMQKKEDNSTIEISSVSIVVHEPPELNDFEEMEDKAILEINNEEAPDIDETTLYSSIVTEEQATYKYQISSHYLEEEKATMSTTPSAPPEEDEILNVNNSELENHVNNTPMNLETAAITIQKVFRNFLFRNKTLSTDDATNVDINALIEDKTEKDDNDMSNMNVNKDRRTLGLIRMDTVLQTVNEEKSLSQSTDDSSTQSSAATIIQAHVRGYLIRNKLNINKNSSTTSGVDSDGLSFTSMEGDNDNRKNKTILNIHIVPENGHFMSREESMLTSIDLSMDGSPPCSANLHSLGYDTSERRKQLKREDAFQSTSPPSNNSGKLSEDVDSIKEMLLSENNIDKKETGATRKDVKEIMSLTMHDHDDTILTLVNNLDTALEVKSLGPFESPVKHPTRRPHSLPELTSDEMDVITPFTPSEEKFSNNSNLIHSGEFHEVVLPTQVSRIDTSVVRGE